MKPSSSDANVIEYQIYLDAVQMISDLKTLQEQGMKLGDVIGMIGQIAQETSQKTGVSLDVVLGKFKEVDAQLTGMYNQLNSTNIKSLLFGEFGAGPGFKEVKSDLNDVGTSAEGAAIGVDLLRTAFGFLTAMILGQVISAITGAFTDAIQSAKDYYEAIQNITVAQDQMARQGIPVTNQQLLDMVDQLHQKFQQISQVDMTEVVAKAALLTSNYGFSVDQVQQLAEDAATLYRLDPSKPAAEYVTQLVRALEGSRSLAANNEQIAITAAEILQKAKDLNLVSQDTKSITDDHVKMVASLAIEYERLHPEALKLQQDTHNILADSETLSAKWKDFTTTVATTLGPIGELIQKSLILNIDTWIKNLDVARNIFLTFEAVVITGYEVINEVAKGHLTVISEIGAAYQKTLAEVKAAFQDMTQYGNIPLTNTPVTPGGLGGPTTPPISLKPTDFENIIKDYQDYYDSVEKATEEFNRRMQDLQDQYNLNVQKTVEDYNLRVHDEMQNFRLRQLKDEQDFQLRMKELKDRYAMDLEDALRKRDAEAVIKDMEKYNQEKTTAQNEFKLKEEQAKLEEQLKLKQMKEEEQLRLKQMAEEFALEQQKAREQYQQQLSDLSTNLDKQLQEQAVKLGDQYHLNSDQVQKLYDLFTEYYGANGKLANSQQESYIQMIANSQAFVQQMMNIMQGYSTMLNEFNNMIYTPNNIPNPDKRVGQRRYATGGVDLATSATTVTFGEAGPELAMFLPLNAASASGMQVNGFGGGGGLGGSAIIRIEVGSDLEARIVHSALTQAALSIEKVYRSR